MMENKPSQSVNLAQSHKGKFIQKHSLNLKNSPTSADYYSVAMFTLMGLYGLTTCISLYFYDKQNHILQRQLITPLGKKCMIFYKFVSYFSLLLLQSVLLEILLCQLTNNLAKIYSLTVLFAKSLLIMVDIP